MSCSAVRWFSFPKFDVDYSVMDLLQNKQNQYSLKKNDKKQLENENENFRIVQLINKCIIIINTINV